MPLSSVPSKKQFNYKNTFFKTNRRIFKMISGTVVVATTIACATHPEWFKVGDDQAINLDDDTKHNVALVLLTIKRVKKNRTFHQKWISNTWQIVFSFCYIFSFSKNNFGKVKRSCGKNDTIKIKYIIISATFRVTWPFFRLYRQKCKYVIMNSCNNGNNNTVQTYNHSQTSW